MASAVKDPQDDSESTPATPAEPPMDSLERERQLRLSKPKDVILGLMVGVIGAWIFTNNYGYRPLPDGGWQVIPLDFAIACGVPLVAGTAVVYWLLRRHRRKTIGQAPE